MQEKDSFVLTNEEIINGTIKAEDLQNEILQAKRKIRSTALTIILIIFVTVGLIFGTSYANRTHIGGNTLLLPVGNGTSMQETRNVGTAWKNASLPSTLLFRALFVTDSTYTEINPSLASSYEVLDDGYTYVITLRSNQRWSDGELITTDDVVFSIESFLKCENVNSAIATALNKIDGAVAFAEGEANSIKGLSVSGNNITIKLETQYNSFLPMLAQFVIYPEHSLRYEDPTQFTDASLEFFYNPVVSGPYMVDGMDEDYNLVFVKNPYYTDPESEIETIKFCWNYKAMDVDYYPTGTISEMVDYRAMRGYEEYPVDVYFYRYFIFHVEDDEGNKNEAMQDIRVRQAIATAIDVPALLDTLYFSTGTVIHSGKIGDDVALHGYNPIKAKALLEEANYDFNRPFTIAYYYSDITSILFIEKVTEYLEAIGLKVETYKSSAADLYSAPEYDMMLKGLSSFNTEDWYNEYLSTNPNISQILGEEGLFDDLANQLGSVVEVQDYNNILDQLVELEQSLLYKMPLFTLNESVYINSNRLYVPEDISFGNTRYMYDLRISEWKIKKE